MRGCDRCEFGWRTVSDSYPERLVPTPDLSGLPPDLAAVARRDIEARRASLAGSVYPCKECQPTLFYRWAGGHLASKHDRGDCEECQEIARGKRPSRAAVVAAGSAPSIEPPPPTARDERMEF